MAKYTVQLLSRDGRVVGERAFNAARNYEAVEIAERLAQEAAGCSAYVGEGTEGLRAARDRGLIQFFEC